MDETRAESLVRQYSDMLLRIGYTWLNSVDDAQDICQITLIKALEDGRTFSSPEQERAWLIRIAINTCKNWKKSAWFRKTVRLDENLHLHTELPQDSEILDLVQQLPLKYRRVLYLSCCEGWKVREIAQMLHEPSALVSTHLARGKAKLKSMLEEAEHGKPLS